MNRFCRLWYVYLMVGFCCLTIWFVIGVASGLNMMGGHSPSLLAQIVGYGTLVIGGGLTLLGIVTGLINIINR